MSEFDAEETAARNLERASEDGKFAVRWIKRLRAMVSEKQSETARLTERCDAYREALVAQWQPIETAPLGEMVWLWNRGWRHPFPGQRNGDNGAVYVDTCEPEAKGWQAVASHWHPMSRPMIGLFAQLTPEQQRAALASPAQEQKDKTT